MLWGAQARRNRPLTNTPQAWGCCGNPFAKHPLANTPRPHSAVGLHSKCWLSVRYLTPLATRHLRCRRFGCTALNRLRMQPLEDLVVVAAAEGGAADPLPPRAHGVRAATAATTEVRLHPDVRRVGQGLRSAGLPHAHGARLSPAAGRRVAAPARLGDVALRAEDDPLVVLHLFGMGGVLKLAPRYSHLATAKLSEHPKHPLATTPRPHSAVGLHSKCRLSVRYLTPLATKLSATAEDSCGESS